MRLNSKFFLAALAIAGLSLLPSPIYAQEEVPQPMLEAKASVPTGAIYSAVPSKRVWTNDDFPSAIPEPEPVQAEEETAVSKTAAEPAVPEADAKKLQQVQEEVSEEMLAVARSRQKAYDDTLSLVQSRLERETDPFRIQVYQQILKDTLGLQEINRHLLEQFEAKSGQEPAAASSEARQAQDSERQ